MKADKKMPSPSSRATSRPIPGPNPAKHCSALQCINHKGLTSLGTAENRQVGPHRIFSEFSLKGEGTTEIPSSRQFVAVIYFLRSPSILLPEKAKSKTRKTLPKTSAG
jgi:hypothetical protein